MSKAYFSNRMESLRNKLARNLGESNAPLFSKSLIVTQTTGMDNWLTRELTSANGIFANYRFMNQEALFRLVYETLFDESLRSNADQTRYAVFDLLKTDEFKGGFPGVAEYYEDDDMRCIQLAARMADLFDQYQVYRNEMLEAWQNGQMVTSRQPEGHQGNEEADSGGKSKGSDAEDWQRWLWCKLVKEYGIQSKHAIRQQMYGAMDGASAKLKEALPEVHLFGISIYTSFHLDFFKALGKYVDVYHYIMLPNDSRQYNNKLLRAWGSKTLELRSMFDEFIVNGLDDDAESSYPDTLLGRLQQSIAQNKDLEAGDMEPDNSIQVHSCHNPLREVEALYDYLLDLFEKANGELDASDILVVAPDINKYESYVKSVFRSGPVKLPTAISGAAKNRGNTLTAALEMIMTLQEDEMTAENVMALLELHRVRKAFQVDDVSYLRAMVKEAGIRFGRENDKENESHFVSWRYGLERMILGYAMLTGEPFYDHYPLPEAEGSGSYDLLRLKAFVNALEKLFGKQQDTDTLAGWKEFFLEEVVNKMVYSDDFNKDDRAENGEIHKALAYIDGLEMDETGVPYGVFLQELQTRLFMEDREQNLNTGCITFSPAIPARGLPYRVIAFIGLDNDVFPRKDRYLGFDLMNPNNPSATKADEPSNAQGLQPGDRSKKEADKMLFLDTLMAAREKLYLSYRGQSVKENAKLPPSIVLDSLLDYLGTKVRVVKHPMHGYSNKHDNVELFTYLYGENKETDSTKEEEMKEPTEEGSQNTGKKEQGQDDSIAVSVDDFVKFFEAPIDYYFKKVLGIYYTVEDEVIPDTELFELNHLEQWKLKKLFLELEGEPEVTDGNLGEALEALRNKWVRTSRIPLKNVGRKSLVKLWEEAKDIRESYRSLVLDKKQTPVLVNLELEGLKIKGEIEDVFDEQHFINYSFSKDANRAATHRMRAYVKTLILQALNKNIETHHIAANGEIKALPVDPDNSAIGSIQKLARFYLQGREKPLIFTIQVATKLSKLSEEQDIEKKWKNVLKKIKNQAKPGYEESIDNKYLQRLLEEDHFDDFDKEDKEKALEQMNELTTLLQLTK